MWGELDQAANIVILVGVFTYIGIPVTFVLTLLKSKWFVLALLVCVLPLLWISCMGKI